MSIYERLGVAPIINVSGSVTRLGGAPMPEPVLRAFCDAAADAVPLEALQAAASKTIARLTGTDAALVTSGAAASLTLGTAAILAGLDFSRMERLPHCDGFPHEIIVAREQRSGYDHAVRAAGARLVEVGFNEIVANAGVRRTEAWEYEAEVTERTAGILYVYSPYSRPALSQVVERARRLRLPVLVDAAGELPPRANLRDIAATGADLVAFSGGKAIRGPQSTGILCGRRDLIASAALQMLDMDDHPELWSPPEWIAEAGPFDGLPRHGLGRSLKVSKEEIVALLEALEQFTSGAYNAELPRYREHLAAVASALDGSLAQCTLIDRGNSESLPLLEIAIDQAALGRSAFDVCRRLRQGQPPVYPGHGKLAQGILVINPLWLTPQRTEALCRRLKEELAPAR